VDADLGLTDHTLRQLRRTIGFLPPDDFLAELRLALGLAALARARNETALPALRAVADLHPRSHVAGEALFWAGIAAFRAAERDKAALRDAWEPLWERYPDSTWAQRTSVWPGQLQPTQRGH
jgi:TolA-binding protein